VQVLQHSIYLAFGQGWLSSCRSPPLSLDPLVRLDQARQVRPDAAAR
jgi:hypothetical protein